MQYVKELADGARVRVTPETYQVDRLMGDVTYLVRGDAVCIYHTNKPGYKPHHPKTLKYGGRGRGFATGHSVYHGG